MAQLRLAEQDKKDLLNRLKRAEGQMRGVQRMIEDKASLSCAIAYDTRHRSRHFAELCAGIMVAAGFRVYFLDGYRSTPELSYLVRQRNCSWDHGHGESQPAQRQRGESLLVDRRSGTATA